MVRFFTKRRTADWASNFFEREICMRFLTSKSSTVATEAMTGERLRIGGGGGGGRQTGPETSHPEIIAILFSFYECLQLQDLQ